MAAGALVDPVVRHVPPPVLLDAARGQVTGSRHTDTAISQHHDQDDGERDDPAGGSEADPIHDGTPSPLGVPSWFGRKNAVA